MGDVHLRRPDDATSAQPSLPETDLDDQQSLCETVNDRNFRQLHGGAFLNQPPNLRSAQRNRNQPTNRDNNIGFRPALAGIRQRPVAYADRLAPQSVPGCLGDKSRSWSRVESSTDGPAERSSGTPVRAQRKPIG
jgi:hypothetical protein